MSDPTPLLGAARLREVLNRHKVRPTKSLGQNFVIDPNTIRKVVAISGVTEGDRVLEVGAGAGSLTLGLAGAGASVVAVEVDDRLVGALREVAGDHPAVEIIAADALDYDLGGSGATMMVANLPYNVAASVVIRALETAPSLDNLTVMTQREVGERLAAAPGGKQYGLTSVLVGFYGRAGLAAPVSRRAFYPVPNVDSVIVRIDRHDELPGVDPRRFKTVVRAAFAQRRKMLRRCLADLAGSLGDATELLRRAGIPENARAEEVPVERFIALTAAMEDPRTR